MREKEESSGGLDPQSAERHREALEAAAWQLSAVAPRFFKAVKATMADNMELPKDMREMGESQLRVLQSLSHGRHRSSDLAKQFNVTNPTISNIVDSLVRKGYVRREYDMDDRRCIYLELTGQGQEVGDLMRGHFQKAMVEFLKPLTDEQLADIVRAFKHLESLVPEVKEVEGEIPAHARRAARHAANHFAHHTMRGAVRGAQREVRRQMRDMQRDLRRQNAEK
jgi:DNA-binding MarR family transcriptional regulator